MTVCLKHHGIDPPTFEERQGFVIVTFRAGIRAGDSSPGSSEKSSEKILAILAMNAERVAGPFAIALTENSTHNSGNTLAAPLLRRATAHAMTCIRGEYIFAHLLAAYSHRRAHGSLVLNCTWRHHRQQIIHLDAWD